ncbi:MAG: hypothetical protein MOGMAGMI_01662 [Candidatus Omnitrophica bacterium]|nr:hypothetical protein [Candidatus Omnitrophota bacterium]
MNKRPSPAWLYASAGTAVGLVYAGVSLILDSGLLDNTSRHVLIGWIHEFVDTVLPVVSGATAGLGLYYYRRQRLLNRRLSSRNDRLKQDLLFHALISQILHEIQNPVHNLSAVLESHPGDLDTAGREMLRRNLDKLKELRSRYGRVGPLLESLDPEEPVRWKAWFEAFYEDKFAPQVRESGLSVVRDLDDASVGMHPMLLEQVFQTLLSNALEAVERRPSGVTAALHLSSRLTSGPSGPMELTVEIRNPGPYPAEVLEAQGRRPVESRSGLGLGLLLARTILEQAGGDLKLSNRSGEALTEVILPGARA